MSQNDPKAYVDTESGTAHVSRENNVGDTILSMNSGNSAPSYAVAGTLWRDTNTPSTTIQAVSIYDGAAWSVIGYFDTSGNKFYGAALADADLDTRWDVERTTDDDILYGRSAGTDELKINASGVEALNALLIKGQKFQSFSFRIRNNSGTIVHRMGAHSPNDAATFDDKVSGATTVEANTPSLSSSVNFVSGGGLLASINSMFVFNTAAQTDADMLGLATVSYNDTDTAVTVKFGVLGATNINGTTRTWVRVKFRDAASGAVFNINTTNWGTSEITDVAIFGVIA